MQEVLFGNSELSRPPEPVVMSLNPEYYELMWQGLKRHEFRRRYLASRPTIWYAYLTAPVSRLSSVIDLDEAISDAPSASLILPRRPGRKRCLGLRIPPRSGARVRVARHPHT